MDHNWRSRKNSKLKHAKTGSEPGKNKANCQIKPIDKIMAKNSRSYKMRGYNTWIKKCKEKNRTK